MFDPNLNSTTFHSLGEMIDRKTFIYGQGHSFVLALRRFHRPFSLKTSNALSFGELILFIPLTS
jgi:hypothetical protein